MSALTRACAPRCAPKTPYKTKAEAQNATRVFKQHEVVVYKCKYCNKHHIIFP